MHRFFCLSSSISADKIIIEDRAQVHHIKDVLRLKPGEKVAVFDEKGNSFDCVLLSVKDKVCLEIRSRVFPAADDTKVKLTLACAIPKKAKLDDIIDKLVQLGVYRIIPLKTERTIVKMDKHKELGRFERWKKIALSAAKQSQRSIPAVIEPVRSFKEMIKSSAGFDLKLIPHLSGERLGLKDILDKFFRDGSLPKAEVSPQGGHFKIGLRTVPEVLVLIGPEGDFSEAEVNLALEAGFIPVTLGDLVLRVDTAAIAAAGFIKLYASN